MIGDVREKLAELPDQSLHCCVTSPPYWGLRDYGVVGQIGLEPNLDDYINTMVGVFREVRRVLRDDGTLWLNLGDGYVHGGNGTRDTERWPKQASNDHRLGHHDKSHGHLKPKDLMMMPARVALALQADGWWLRSDIIWHKPNPMPESVTDRPTSAHEHVFLLSKGQRYFFDAEAVKVQASPDTHTRCARGHSDDHKYSDGGPGNQTIVKTFSHVRKTDKQRGHSRRHAGFNDRWDSMSVAEQRANGANIRNVWTIATQGYPEAHFATFPTALVEPCIKAGCPTGGTVLDPFGGSGTTGLVADQLGRNAILIELNPEYAAMAQRRIKSDGGMFVEVAAE